MSLAESRRHSRPKSLARAATGRAAHLAERGREITRGVGAEAQRSAETARSSATQAARAGADYARRHPLQTGLVAVGLLTSACLLANPAARAVAVRGLTSLWRAARPAILRSAASRLAVLAAGRRRD